MEYSGFDVICCEILRLFSLKFSYFQLRGVRVFSHPRLRSIHSWGGSTLAVSWQVSWIGKLRFWPKANKFHNFECTIIFSEEKQASKVGAMFLRFFAQAMQLQLVLHLGRQRRKRYILMLRNKLTVKNICRMTYSKPTSFLVTQHIVFSGEAS